MFSLNWNEEFNFLRRDDNGILTKEPLTPALSRWEREKLFPHRASSMQLDSPDDQSRYNDSPPLFPLPEGEGQGEGKRVSTLDIRHSPFEIWAMSLPYKIATLLYCFNERDEILLL